MSVQPHIVVLDTYPFIAEHFRVLEAFGRCTFFESTPPESLYQRIQAADLVLTNKTRLSAEAFAQAPRLKYVGVVATGYNVVDVAAAAERGIVVTNVPAYGTATVAQHTFALLLELTNHVQQYATLARSNQWADGGAFCVLGPILEELEGKTLGIIGFGAIGQQVARIASAFGMQVKVWSRTPRAGHAVVFCSQQELLQQSDVISLHCPLTPETRHIINQAALAQMKPSAILLNTSRGALIDEAALFTALSTGKLAAAGLDVLNEEPPARDHPLLSLPNCLATPHIAWNGRAARSRVLKLMAENVAAFLKGQPQNIVS